MDEDEFWDTVGLLDRDRGGDDVAAAEPLVAYLATLPNGELFAFDDALAEHLRALDRRDVAERAFGRARGRFFPDEFLGWRCACVAGGRDRWEDALAALGASRRGALRGAHVRPHEGVGPQVRRRPRRLPPRALPRLPDLRQRGGLVLGRPYVVFDVLLQAAPAGRWAAPACGPNKQERWRPTFRRRGGWARGPKDEPHRGGGRAPRLQITTKS